MKQQLGNRPYFIILVTLFYLLSLVNEFYPILTANDLFLPVSAWLMGISLLLFLIISFISKSLLKYALWILYLQMVFFFFGPFQDFLKENIPALSHYSYVLPFLGLVALIILIAAIRNRSFSTKHFTYLNVLGIILVLIELSKCFAINATDGKARFWFTQKKEDTTFATPICDTCLKPDIYFVIFDGYSNSRTLKNYWNYDNKEVDSFFIKNGFYYVNNSKSNYNSTPYSIGSILNMDYHLQKLDRKIDIHQFIKGIESIETNRACAILQKNDYTIINQSCFPLSNQKPPLNITYLMDKDKILLAQTLWNRTISDIGWNFRIRNTASKTKQTARGRLNLEQVKKAYKLLLTASAQKNQKPVFVYAHFFIPHDPYFYDSTGSITPESTWSQPAFQKERYLSQLKYTNTVIKDVTTHLLTEGNRPRVIIIQSDHGYRSFSKAPALDGNDNRTLEFNNLNAIHFPDQDYAGLYDSISSVNTFRVVLKKYFKQPIPLLKDSSVYIKR